MAGSVKGRRPGVWSRVRGPLIFLAIVVGAGAGVRYILAHPELILGGTSRRPRPVPPPAPEGWPAIEAGIQGNRWDEVEPRLTAWVKDHPKDGRALVVLVGLRNAQGRLDEAKTAAGRVDPSDPNWLGAWMLLGDSAFQRKDAPEATQIYQSIVQRLPDQVLARTRLVYLMSIQLRTAEARRYAWELFRLRPAAEPLADLVQQLFQPENDVRSLNDDLDQFQARTLDDPFLCRARGLSLHWRGRSEEARPLLEKAAAGLADDPLGRFALAECRIAAGDNLSSFPVERILRARPATSPAAAARWLVYASRIKELQGKPDEALPLLREAVELAPGDREARFRLARQLDRRKETAEADLQRGVIREIDAKERAIRAAIGAGDQNGYSPLACENLGAACRAYGLSAETQAWYQLALAKNPGSSAAKDALSLAGPSPDPIRSLPFALNEPRLGPAGPGELLPPLSQGASAGSAIVLRDVAAETKLVAQYDASPRPDLFIADTMGGGVALIDYDRDGRLDVYVINGCPLPVDPKSPPAPNRLFRNKPDGTFDDVTAKAGVGGRGYGMGATVADYDGDGFDDLFVTGFRSTCLYRNKGDGTFEDVSKKVGVWSDRWSTAAGFGDMDGDGDLDLYVVTYVAADPKSSPECKDQTGRPIHCSPGYFEAEQDLLYRNNGDGTFTDVSKPAGIEQPRGRGLGLAIVDLDEDGRLDLFVANDASPNFAFRNLGGLKFEEVAVSSGLAVNGSGRATASMGVVADDLDGDGLVDIFHTNFLNESSTLRKNLGAGQFEDVTLAAGLDSTSRALTGFGAVAFDGDLDGDLDLFVTNGHVDDQPWVNVRMAQSPLLLTNKGDGRFSRSVGDAASYLSRTYVGRGVASGDLDNDGKVDLVVVHRDAPLAFLRNESRTSHHWIGLDPVGRRGTAVGAKVTLKAGGKTQTRWLTSGTSYLSSSDRRLVFGLGGATAVDSIEIRWPSGRSQTIQNPQVDRYTKCEETR